MKRIYSLLFAMVAFFACATAQDYASWYVNVLGPFNEWLDNGVHPGSDNVSVTTLSDLNTNFKIKVWNGTEDLWWTTAGGELPVNQWVALDANVDDMTLPAELQSGAVTIKVNVATKKIYVEAGGAAPVNPNPTTPDPTPVTPGDYPATFHIMGNIAGSGWTPGQGIAANLNGSTYTWSGITVQDAGEGYGYVGLMELNSSKWDGEGGINSGLRYGPFTANEELAAGQTAQVTLEWNSFKIAAGSYDLVFDIAAETVTLTASGSAPVNPNPTTPDPTPVVPGEYPATFHIMGNIAGSGWTPGQGIAANLNGTKYTWSGITVQDAGEGYGYVGLMELNSSEWDGEGGINSGLRYGPFTANEELAAGQTAQVTLEWNSFKIAAGSYDLVFDIAAETVTLTASGAAPVNPNPTTPDPTPVTPGNYPATFHIMGNIAGSGWTPGQGIAANLNGTKYTWSGITVQDAGEGYGYVGLMELNSSEWDGEGGINSGLRYGPFTANEELAAGQTAQVTLEWNSFKIAAGSYDLVFDIAAETVTLTAAGSAPVTPDPTTPDPTPVVPGDYPATFYVMGNVAGSSWTPGTGIAANLSGSSYTWKGLTVEDAGEGYGYVGLMELNSSEWDGEGGINSGLRYGPFTANEELAAGQTAQVTLEWNSFKIAAGTYDLVFDIAGEKVSLFAAGSAPVTPDPTTPDPTTPDPVVPGDYPATFYVMGNIAGSSWTPGTGIAANLNGSSYTWKGLTVEDAGEGYGYVGLMELNSSEWDGEGGINSGLRYGPFTEDEELAAGQTAQVTLEWNSFKIAAGTYDLVFDIAGEKVSLFTAGSAPVNPDPTTPDPTTPDPVVPGDYPSTFYVMGNIAGSSWTPGTGIAANLSGSSYTWMGLTVEDAGEGYGYVGLMELNSSEWDGEGGINSGLRYGPFTEDEELAAGQTAQVTLEWNSFKIAAGSYDLVFDIAGEKVSLFAAGSAPVNPDPTTPDPTTPDPTTPDPTTPDPVDPDPVVPGDYPATFYVMGNIAGSSWTPGTGIAANLKGNSYTWTNLTVEDAGEGYGYVGLVELNSNEWDGDGGINSGLRYGPFTANEILPEGMTVEVTEEWNSFKIAAGKYDLTFNIADLNVTLKKASSSVEELEAAALCGDVYNYAGVCIMRNADEAAVKALPAGLYIVGGKKVLVK